MNKIFIILVLCVCLNGCSSKSQLQELPTIITSQDQTWKNCRVQYNPKGWLGVWREGEEIPGLVFYAELKADRNGDVMLPDRSI